MSEIYAGVDISAWNGEVDFIQLKAGKLKDIPISFVMIRLGVGKNIDTRAIRNINSALDAGLDVGVYHYTTARTPDEARYEAELVLRTIKDNGFDGKLTLPIAFDIEENEILGLGKEVCTAIVKSFMQTVADENYQPMFYTYAAAYNNNFYKDELKAYPLWIAAYISEKLLNNTFGITDYAMWQFGVAGNPDYDLQMIGKVPGVTGQCDVDYMYENLPAKIKAEGKNVFPSRGVSYTVTVSDIPSKESAEDILSYARCRGFCGVITENNPPEPEPQPALAVGDRVRMQYGAPIYGTTQEFASWVYSAVLYVREINGNRVVVSTQRTGDITGAVDAKYLTKI